MTAIAFNAFMLISIWTLINTDAILREIKTSYTLPDGFTSTKTKITWDDSLPPPSGWVVRYASAWCIYCNLDFEWDHLASLLEHLNYRIILLPPKEMDQINDVHKFSKNMQQMTFVKMDWIKQFRFTGTPTIAIFDNKGRMLWHHTGMLKDVDYEFVKKIL